MTAIERLRTLIPPPTAPVAAAGDWDQVESLLGTRLPLDYRLLIATYGMGTFGDLLVRSPFAADPYLNMVNDNLRTLESYRHHRIEYPEQFRYPLHPEPGGLLLWARTGNGDQLGWLTDPSHDPDRWPVVIVYRHRQGFDKFPLPATGLLHDYFSGRLEIAELGAAAKQPWFDALLETTEISVQVTDGVLPYDEQLRILRESLAPTADRRTSEIDEDDRQDQFRVVEHDWMVTFEDFGSRQIRIAYPAGDDQRAREVITAAIEAMGAQIRRTVPPGWITVPHESDQSVAGNPRRQ